MTSPLCQACREILAYGIREYFVDHHSSRESILAAGADGCRLCSQVVKSAVFASLDTRIRLESSAALSMRQGETLFRFRIVLNLLGVENEDYLHMRGLWNRVVTEDGDVLIPQSGSDTSLKDPAFPDKYAREWRFLCYPEADFPPRYVQDTSLARTEGADDMWELARSWLDECCQNHKCCSVLSSETFCPTRLVEIVNDSNVRVIECSKAQSSQRYAALSHCWGESETLKLLSGNKNRFETNINISELPQSYKEAFDVCQHMNIKYIWIDSLCIIQDSTDDWRAESATMMHVYGSAVFTIAAAAAAENSEPSFLHRDPLNIAPTRIMVPHIVSGHTPGASYLMPWKENYEEFRKCPSHGASGDTPDSPYIVTRENRFEDISSFPLSRRAWVLQESYISNRILFLADTQLWWQCREALCSESWPCGFPAWRSEYNESRNQKPIQKPHSHWNQLVEDYTGRKLTNFSDKLIAMAGLANHFQSSIGEDEYVAGLWRSQLPKDLCWGPFDFGRRLWPIFRPSQYRAPSWSWASLEGCKIWPAYEDENPTTYLCQILSIHLARAGANPYGDLKGGYLFLRGRLCPIEPLESSYKGRDSLFGLRGVGGRWGISSYIGIRWDESLFDKGVISHIDTSGVDLLRDASLATAKRITKVGDRWEGDLFFFPVFELQGFTGPRMRGLILGRAKGEPANRYQRIGQSCYREEDGCVYIRGAKIQEFFLI